jgi:hypothetical protein
MMTRLRLVACAIRGHSWIDYSIDYRPEYTQRYERCQRCQLWTMREISEPAPWERR